MQTEIVPIAIFVSRKIHVMPVKPMLEPLGLDPMVVEGILVSHFQEMGIFLVPPTQERMITSHIMKMIRTSPEIQKIAIAAARERAKAKTKRIAGE